MSGYTNIDVLARKTSSSAEIIISHQGLLHRGMKKKKINKIISGALELKTASCAVLFIPLLPPGSIQYLLSHPGQLTLASSSQAASRGDRSRSSWPQPDGRRRRTHPESALRPYQSLTAPWKDTAQRWVWADHKDSRKPLIGWSDTWLASLCLLLVSQITQQVMVSKFSQVCQ